MRLLIWTGVGILGVLAFITGFLLTVLIIPL